MDKTKETKEEQIQGWYEWLKRRSDSDGRTSKLILKTYLDNMERVMNMEWGDNK